MIMNIEEVIRQVYSQARLLGSCHRFKGTEKTLEDIVALFCSPQGMEFCINNRFPNMATFRLFKPFEPEKQGVYIDLGVLTLRNPKRVVLVGRTSATITCDTLERHEVFLLHGAKAIINASGWSVVSVSGSKGCQVIRNISGNAVIL